MYEPALPLLAARAHLAMGVPNWNGQGRTRRGVGWILQALFRGPIMPGEVIGYMVLRIRGPESRVVLVFRNLDRVARIACDLTRSKCRARIFNISFIDLCLPLPSQFLAFVKTDG